MKKLIVIVAFATAAFLMVNFWLSREHRTAAGTDRNVPGATTGQGRNSLSSQ
jgi:hypothetical protein